MTQTRPDNTKNPLEWTVFGIGCVLILATFSCLIWYALGMEDGPARIGVRISDPIVEDGRVRVPVEVTNSGRSVASGVEVKVSGTTPSGVREAGFTLDYVPRGASRKGHVTFRGSEMPVDLKCEVIGYEEP